MTKLKLILFVLSAVQFLSGCAPKELFYWGNYENSLYERYMENNSEQASIFLQQTIDNAVKENQRVPPGLYADYGFILYQRGDKHGAISFFEKEKTLYPESEALMTKLIKRVKGQFNNTQLSNVHEVQ